MSFFAKNVQRTIVLFKQPALELRMQFLQEFMTSQNILIGADPEVFVRSPHGLVSGHIFICGTKARPKQTMHGSVQVDGTALEFNVRPADSAEAFVQNVSKVFDDLREIITARGEYIIDRVTTAMFGHDFLARLPRKNRELGCNPDYSAYTREENPKPNDYLPFRTGAGHVHIGWRRPSEILQEHFMTCVAMTQELDYYLGIPSFRWDHDDQRRQMYGQAGSFRPKKYGVEYRVLSNAWVFSEDLISEVFKRTKRACNNIKSGVFVSKEFPGLAKDFIDSQGKISLPSALKDIIDA
jgi:hypothetical protein